MYVLLITLHIIGVATCLGTRLVAIFVFKNIINEGTNERLDELTLPLQITSYGDIGLAVGVASSGLYLLLQDIPLSALHWALKLKFIVFFLLITAVGAFHIAKSRTLKHYDVQMLPALQRLNSLAVTLMCCMVLFSVFSM